MIIGKKGSGKSKLFCDLLLDPQGYNKKYDRIIFISPTFRTQYEGLWKALDPKGITVYEEVSETLLTQIIEQQFGTDKNCLVVFDDCGENLKHLPQEALNLFISNSRHLHLSVVFLNQRFIQIPTIVRANTDCFIVFSACSQTELDALYREVSIVDKKKFMQLFRSVTDKPYAYLCISVIAGKISFFANCKEPIDVTEK